MIMRTGKILLNKNEQKKRVKKTTNHNDFLFCYGSSSSSMATNKNFSYEKKNIRIDNLSWILTLKKKKSLLVCFAFPFFPLNFWLIYFDSGQPSQVIHLYMMFGYIKETQVATQFFFCVFEISGESKKNWRMSFSLALG